LKTSSLPSFALKSPNKIFISYLGNWSNTRPTSSLKLSVTLSHKSSHEACTFISIMLHQRPLNIIYDALSLRNSDLLSADTILLRTKNLSLTYDPVSLLHSKTYNPLPVQCHHSPIWPPVNPLSLTYTSPTPFLPSSVNLTYTGSSHSTFLISYPLPVLRSCQRILLGSKLSITLRNKVAFLRWGVVSPRPTPSWRATPCRLSATVYLIYSQLPFISWGRLLHPQPEDAPCQGESGPT
jgi:hypothetical protein